MANLRLVSERRGSDPHPLLAEYLAAAGPLLERHEFTFEANGRDWAHWVDGHTPYCIIRVMVVLDDAGQPRIHGQAYPDRLSPELRAALYAI